MAHTTLAQVVGKLSDFTLCSKCNSLNRTASKNCVHEDCDTFLTETDSQILFNWVLAEEKFWEEEGYDEAEIDQIEYYV
jgi:hypothetical protein